ncbi:DUF2971 domain-containing protein [Pseudooctadecabacter sp.]|uniref:DUF2971 domain-containing protein n=1 Tax=Pseudooctadecabacter sp. TaxID=1966338 RepID=UPI0035C87353
MQELPQFPTTCFSKSPIVSPMWAHYADNHSGFVLEFDSDRIKEHHPHTPIRDVDYLEAPKTDLHDLLAKASVVGKPRHASWLRDAVFSAAYFSKYAEWAYEQECRMVVDEENCEEIVGNHILFLPASCISAVIVGSKFPEPKLPSVKDIAGRYGYESYEVVIGKSYPTPYLLDDQRKTRVFSDGQIVETDFICESCSEPLNEEGEQCPWCRITEDHQRHAAMTNPFRILDHYGALDGYLEDVANIKRRFR